MSSNALSTASLDSGADSSPADPAPPALLVGSLGSDTMAGTSGSDILRSGAGDDLLFYRLADQAAGTHDAYNGGQGYDTLELVFTPEQLAQAGFLESLAQQLQAFRAMVAAQLLPTGELSAAQDARFTFTFGDWSLSVARIEEIRVAPMLASATLDLDEGGTAPVTWANFGYSDPSAPSVVMSVLWADSGRFEVRVGDSWVEARSFTGAQLRDGQVRFVHGGSELSPHIYVRASEGGEISNTLQMAVEFASVNDEPKILGSTVAVRGVTGEAVRVNTGNLQVWDPDSLPIDVNLQVQASDHGGFVRLTSPTTVAHTDSFTLRDMNLGSIFWRPDDSGEVGHFTLQVDDGQAQGATFSASVSKILFASPSASLTGTSDNDVMLGEIGNNVLSGGDGADRIDGLLGDDTIYGGDGDDNLSGGFATMTQTSGQDVLYGGNGADVMFGGDDDDTLKGDAGNDSLYGGPGTDSLDGGDGSDYLDGGDGNDTIAGGAGDDILLGIAGMDSLDGGSGNDILSSGLGMDILTGGLGQDHFLFAAALQANDGDPNNIDLITDFNRAEGDLIVVRTIEASAFQGLDGREASDVLGDYVRYDPVTGLLSYDADGVAGPGAAVAFARLGADTHPADFRAVDLLVAAI